MSRYTPLQKLGFSRSAIIYYESLLEHGPATAKRLADRLGIPPSNTYSALGALASQGFIVKHKLTTLPTLYTALPINRALPHRYMRQRDILLPLCHELKIEFPPAFNTPVAEKFTRHVIM